MGHGRRLLGRRDGFGPETRSSSSGMGQARFLPSRRKAKAEKSWLRPKPASSVEAVMERHGAMPLPPYIARARPADDRDRIDYQTVYARAKGAVAAPTAGLHFTPELLERLSARGIRSAFVTLHVGAGTFLPVKTEKVDDHPLHAEQYEVSPKTADIVNRCRAEGGRIVAIGTTSLRVLETASQDDGVLKPSQGLTRIFIRPGHRFRSADLLLTNFHLPKSTLFMLVCAFSGTALMKRAYSHAIASGFRFYSYGDACLLVALRLPPHDRAFFLQAPLEGWRGAARRNFNAARRHPDASLHAGGDGGDRQGDVPRRRQSLWRGRHPRQHLSSHAAPRRRADRAPWRPAPLYALGRPDPDQLRRLSSDVARPASHRFRTRRQLPLAHRRRPSRVDARAVHRGAEPTRRRHPDAVRRVHALPAPRGTRPSARCYSRFAGPSVRSMPSSATAKRDAPCLALCRAAFTPSFARNRPKP